MTVITEKCIWCWSMLVFMSGQGLSTRCKFCHCNCSICLKFKFIWLGYHVSHFYQQLGKSLWSIHCNTVLTCFNTMMLQLQQKAATWLELNLDHRPYILAGLQELHWLPVKYCITFNVAILLHQTLQQRHAGIGSLA